MSIEHLKKDLTSIRYGLVAHGVNCMGKMGCGVALAVRKKWPTAYNEYIKITPNKQLLGTAQFVYIRETLIVANCFTQIFYGINGRFANVNAIDSCLEEITSIAHFKQLPIYMPKMGCGLGGLEWEEVLPLLKKYDNEHIDIHVCEI